jgi:hypothetical protein
MRQWLRTRWHIFAVIVAACFAAAYVAQWQFSLFWKLPTIAFGPPDPIRDRAMFPKTFNAYRKGKAPTFNSEGCQRSMVGRPVLELMARDPKKEAERDMAAGQFVLYARDMSQINNEKFQIYGAECSSPKGSDVSMQFKAWPDIAAEYSSFEAYRRFGKDAYRPPDYNCSRLYTVFSAHFQSVYNVNIISKAPPYQAIPCSINKEDLDVIKNSDWPW